MSGTKYPFAIDTGSELILTTDNVTPVKAKVVNDLRGAILAIETELGIDPSREYATVRARLDAMQGIINALQSGSGSGNANLTTLPPVNITKSSAQVGVIQLAALSDHKHDVSTSSATSISNVNSEGSSTFLARADHTHQVTGFNISGQVQGSILYYNGSSWIALTPSTDGFILTTHGSGNNPTWTQSTGVALSSTLPTAVDKNISAIGIGTTAARADHHHQASTAAPISIGNANTEGTSLSLARADHLHNLSGNVGGDLSGTLPNPTVTNFHIPGASTNSVLYYNGTNWVVLSAGQDGYVLTTHSTTSAPSWGSLPGGIALAVVAPLDTDKNAAVVGVSARAAHEDHRHMAVTASAISIGIANTEGTSTSLARADHTHLVNALNISGQTTGDLLQFNGTAWVRLPASTSGTVLTANGVSTLPTWNALPAGLSLATVAPVNVDKAAAILGVSPRAAKEDHKHSTNTASAISVGTVNAEGTATTLARSDHTHLVSGLTISGQTTGDLLIFNGTSWVRFADSTAGLVLTANGVGTIPSWQASPTGVILASTPPADVDANAAVIGVGTTAARSDHKHLVSTATPVSIGATNVLGSAISLSRSDHQHSVVDLHITSQVQGNILFFNGTNWVVLTNGTAGQALTTQGIGANPIWSTVTTLSAVAPVNVNGNAAAVGVSTTAARSDHKHNADFATAVTCGATNSAGTSINFSRADHLHAISDFAIAGQSRGDIVFYNGTNWVRLPGGQDGYVLTTHGTIANPTWNIVTGGGGGAISSVFTRTGVITATLGDYSSSLITNLSSVAGATVTLALNNLLTSVNALPALSNVAPVNVNTNVASQGVATTAARSDHKHNIDVAAAVSVGAVNAIGTATTLARSDHTHQVIDLHITSQVQGNILFFNGTNWVVLTNGTAGNVLTTNGVAANPTWSSLTSLLSTSAPVNVNGTVAAIGIATTAARSDHKHNVDFGTPIAIGLTLSAGTATTLVRSDHVHTVVASQVTNDSSVTGTRVSDALNTLRTSAGIIDTSTAGGSTVLTSLNNIITDIQSLTTDDISNTSIVSGLSASNSLNNLLLQYPNGSYNITASFTLSNANIGKIGLMTNNAFIICTIPTFASSGIVVGSKFTLFAYANPFLTFTAASGVVIHNSVGSFPQFQYNKYILECIATNEWNVIPEYNTLDGSFIVNSSNVTGFTVTNALNTLLDHSFTGDMAINLNAILVGDWAFDSSAGWTQISLSSNPIIFPVYFPKNISITKVVLSLIGSTSHTALPNNMPIVSISYLNSAGLVINAQSAIDSSGSVGVYTAAHNIVLNLTTPVSVANGAIGMIWVNVLGESGTNSKVFLRIINLTVTYT